MTDRPSLDPEDWSAFRALAHDMLDKALDHVEGAAERPVWRPAPADVKNAIAEPTPLEPQGAAKAAEDLLRDILPYATGNTHPRFFGWVHGAGSAGSIVAEAMQAAMNANLGGRDHAPIYVERQVIAWMREVFGFPSDASGLVVSGTSIATLIALATARLVHAPYDVKREGFRQDTSKMVGYTSAEGHSCVAKSFDQLGLGLDALRKIPVGDDYSMDLDALRAAVAADRAAGHVPFCVVGAAATVNTAAMDDLDAIADLAAAEGLWFHVDGAFGAVGVLSDKIRPRLKGIERADSLAFDFHKWMPVAYDAGMVLIRDGDAHRRAFSLRAEYLKGEQRGLAGGDPWFCDFGPELSRGFRALKIWFALKEHGLRRIGEKVEDNCAQAAYLADLVDRREGVETAAPVGLNIACFRYVAAPDASLDDLNRRIVIDLQESGIAAPSTTTLKGRTAIRVNITNHRTTLKDMEILLDAVMEAGERLA
ncbi:MAG: pyridoxal-dependent decarboxylase [Pseudomonadota bacterium]